MSPRASEVRTTATADQHGNSGAVNDARENIAAEFVSAKPVRRRWRVETRGQMDRSGVLWRDPRSEQREDHEDYYQHYARGGERIVPGISGNPMAERDGGGRHFSSYN